MNVKPQSRKEARDRRRRENFVGRSEQIRQFEENFLHDDPVMVFSVTGEGGVGKSTLLKQFANIAGKHNAIVITCDDTHTSPAFAMGHIAGELAKAKFTHGAFDERYKEYRKLRQEVEGDPKAPHGAIDLIARGVTDAAIKSARRVPGASPFLEHVDEKAAGETLSQFVHYAIDRWGNKDEVQLMREPERILAPLFLELVAKATEKQRLLLMFDVFERTSESLATWLLALFDFEYGDFSANLIFVIAGREPLEQHWTELTGDICHMPLEPFTPEETRAYLNNRAITDDRLVEQIHEDTGGLPVLVELLAATNPQPGAPLPDVSKDAVERFLQWIEQEDRRQAALLAAVPRRFNRDLLTAALGSDATTTFNWLSTQSFVRRSAEDGWFYHEKVRELMLRHLRNTTPKDLDVTHARMADFLAQAQSELKLEGKEAYDSETWRKFECEQVYHFISAHPDRNGDVAVNAFLHAFRWRRRFAEEIAECCQQSGREKGSQTIRDLADTLSGFYRAYDQDDYRIGIEKLGSLERRNELTTTSRCEIHARRGVMYRLEKKNNEALGGFTRAIELDEKYSWAIRHRGLTYRQMGRYEEALGDFTRAIELDEKYSWAIGHRGETYRQMGRYEEALTDFNRAIELDGKQAWVLEERGLTFRQTGKYEEALADYRVVVELDSEDSDILLGLLACYRKLGLTDEYQRRIEIARELFAKESEYSRACFAAIVSDTDDALALLRTALERGPKNVEWVRCDPDFYWMRDDPRFTALLEEMAMPS